MTIALVLICSALVAGEEAEQHDPVALWLNAHSHELMQGTLAVMGLVGDFQTVRDASVTVDAMLASLASAEALKLVIDQPRPRDPSATDGFPSSHAATAFAFARGLTDWRADWGPWVYVFATGVGWARIEEGFHTPEQVVAGAVLGLWIAGASLENNGFVIHRSSRPTPLLPEGVEGAAGFDAGPCVVLWRQAW
ncbi:MAG: phosphatase PAP2 family protein [Armatimonadota bacterium]|jgi:hypothetical protein